MDLDLLITLYSLLTMSVLNTDVYLSKGTTKF